MHGATSGFLFHCLMLRIFLVGNSLEKQCVKLFSVLVWYIKIREYMQDEGMKLDLYNGYCCRFQLTCVTRCQLQQCRKQTNGSGDNKDSI